MNEMSKLRIAIIGAGPIGLEAALEAHHRGYDVTVLERGRVAENVRRWGAVTLFSPFAMNHSRLGRETLERAGHELPPDDAYLTGRQHVERYLLPLSRAALPAERIMQHCTVVAVGREGLSKSDMIGGPRQERAFRLLLEREGSEEILHADFVLDCSGTYGNHNWIGNGNIPAPGERAAAARIDYTLQDVAGARREAFEGKRILLVGDGYSAATALDDLAALPGTHTTWISKRASGQPLSRFENDPLPRRDRLAQRCNALCDGANPAVDFLAGATVEAIELDGERVQVTLADSGNNRRMSFDRILGLVGYTPDNTLYRELQVHECWATHGPMKMAASLLENDAADCLAQESAGAETLVNPEPDFFIVGGKSYGTNSSFLIQLGIQQIQEIFSLMQAGPEAGPEEPVA